MEGVKKTKKRGFLRSHWFLLGLILALGMVGFALSRALYRDYQVRLEIQNLQEQVKQLEAKKIESFELLKYVSSTTFVEETARKELNMVRSGENTAVLINPKADNGRQEKNNMLQSENHSNPWKWWNYFINKLIR